MPAFPDFLDAFGNFVSYWVVSILVAALVALAVWIPPIRKMALKLGSSRRTAAGLVGLAALILCFGLFTRLRAELTLFFSGFSITPDEPTYQQLVELDEKNRASVIGEVWLRDILSPAFARHCYSLRSANCRLVDRLMVEPSDWGGYLNDLGFSVFSGLGSLGLGLWWTRPKKATA